MAIINIYFDLIILV